MKKLLTFALLGAFGAVMAGCEAHAEVDPPRHTSATIDTRTDTRAGVDSSKTTTVRDANGNLVEKKTEIRRD